MKIPKPGRLARCALAMVIALAAAPRTGIAAQLDGDNVLLVYNRSDSDSMAVRRHYLEAHYGIEEFDLNQKVLVGRHTITHEEFRRLIRQPLRKHLAARRELAERIICIVLTKGIPHRIDDDNHPGCGDNAARMRAEWLEHGDFTAASVDSELTLLWMDLERGEAGGKFDSRADGFIANPYFGSRRRITEFNRAFAMKPKTLEERVPAGDEADGAQAGWDRGGARLPVARLEPGDIYLVTRLDAPRVTNIVAMIRRGSGPPVRMDEGAIVLDGNDEADLDKGDYARAAASLARKGWPVRLDRAADFIQPADEARPLFAYIGYGLNDPAANAPDGHDYIRSYKFLPGAVFNTLESFNGRDFGGAGDRAANPQTQLSDFLAAGGTFGIGNVWEPFAFSSARNEYLLDRFFNEGWTWAEAAYCALPALSWQQIVVGDPLGRIRIEKPAE